MATSLTFYCAGVLVAFFLYLFISAFSSPLRAIPGPFLARCTRLWFAYRVWRGRFDLDILALHRKYGPTVLFGPNHVCFSDPEAVKVIYGSGTEFDKANWYQAWSPPGFTSLFSEQSVKAHGQMRRKIQSTFNMSSMVSYETFVEQCTAILCTRLEEIAGANETTDLYRWLLSYAGDAISLMTYSRRMGFLDAGQDVGDFFKTLYGSVRYSLFIGIFSEFHRLIYKTMNQMSRFGIVSGAPRMFLARFNARLIAEKRELRAEKGVAKNSQTDQDEHAPKDFLSKFLDFNERDSTKFTERDIHSSLIGNVVAGADTTGATLTAIFYCLLKTPSAMQKLRSEISAARTAGTLSSPPTFKQTSELPYLQAVIQESLRMYPTAGLPIQRVVPAGGYEICGHFLPGGTVVGIQLQALHMNSSVFGSDAETFRPERWLDANKEQSALMHRNMAAFGLGSRNCIGRHVSVLEMSKLIPELVTKFDFVLADGLERDDKEMEWLNRWFMMPVKLPVRVRIRQRQN